MPQRVEVELLDRIRPQLVTLVTEDARRLPGMRYCDVRIQLKEEKGAVAENGSEKASAEDYVFDFGVRAIAGGRNTAPGYFGKVLGSSDTDRVAEVVMDGIRQAHQRGPGQRTDEGQGPASLRSPGRGDPGCPDGPGADRSGLCRRLLPGRPPGRSPGAGRQDGGRRLQGRPG